MVIVVVGLIASTKILLMAIIVNSKGVACLEQWITGFEVYFSYLCNLFGIYFLAD